MIADTGLYVDPSNSSSLPMSYEQGTSEGCFLDKRSIFHQSSWQCVHVVHDTRLYMYSFQCDCLSPWSPPSVWWEHVWSVCVARTYNRCQSHLLTSDLCWVQVCTNSRGVDWLCRGRLALSLSLCWPLDQVSASHYGTCLHVVDDDILSNMFPVQHLECLMCRPQVDKMTD